MNRPRDTVLFRELATLVTEGSLPESTEIDTMDTLGILRVIHEQDRLVAPAVWQCAPEIARVVDRVTESFRRGGRLIYIGAGTSGRLGILDAAECPPTFGTDPEEVVGIIAGGKDSVFRAREGAEDDAEAGARAVDEHAVGPADTVVGIAASRRTPYVRAALARARERGAFAALVTCNPSSPGPKDADVDVVIAPVVGAEVIAGSTRMKAGTAQKLVLNMISTAAMVRRGKTLGNLMIDLRPGSAKLVERSRGIVARVVDCGYDEAARLLDEAGGSVKTAIVMGRRAVDRAAAERILAEAGGLVRRALLAGGGS
ncbi:MAG: N-acetylmuramic acid 6-phosphate etherase [Candidatus Eiseniibacteriota bacterium]